jgi:L-rhamnose mutarotase
MPRIAFKMQLLAGHEQAYQRRHDALWPQLADLLRQTGIREYSIFLDPDTLALFGVLDIDEPTALDGLPAHPVMQRWWAHMADIMVTHPDHSPVSVPLRAVFYLK